MANKKVFVVPIYYFILNAGHLANFDFYVANIIFGQNRLCISVFSRICTLTETLMFNKKRNSFMNLEKNSS